MNYHELKRAKETFPIHRYEKEYQKLESARLNFITKFSISNLKTMTIDQYVIGKQDKDSFCYIIERTLDGLGRILGKPSNKFGVWFSPIHNRYSIDYRFGNDEKEAFRNVKLSIINLINSAQKGKIQELIDNPLDSLFKGKILSVYFPDRFLNIFSIKHLDYYIRFFNLDTKELMKSDAVLKREALLKFKDSDIDMKKWSVNMFAVFLYRHYPMSPVSDNDVAVSSRERELEFPVPVKIEWVVRQLSASETPKSSPHIRSNRFKSVDYEEDARKYKILGDRGEYIVYQAEIERLKKELNLKNTRDAIKLIDWKSRNGDDACGYDILSKNVDKSNRYIEVKATQGSVGDMVFYYTENELMHAKQYGDSYCIYIVYDILTNKPKICNIGNLFKENYLLELSPIKYRVKVRIKK